MSTDADAHTQAAGEHDHLVRTKGTTAADRYLHLPAEDSTEADPAPMCDAFATTWGVEDPDAWPPVWLKDNMCPHCLETWDEQYRTPPGPSMTAGGES